MRVWTPTFVGVTEEVVWTAGIQAPLMRYALSCARQNRKLRISKCH